MNGDTPVQPAANQPQEPQQASQQPQQPGGQPSSAPNPQPTWQYKSESSAPASAAGIGAQAALPYDPGHQEANWSASEFVDHHKSISWYGALAGITLAVDVLLYFWMHDFVSIFAVTAMAILFAVMGSRKPRVLDYRLDISGLTIGATFHPYAEFKSFSIMEDGALQSITFSPLKRFMPPVSVFFAPEDEEKIIDVLAQHLPMEVRQRDAVDRFSRRIRF